MEDSNIKILNMYIKNMQKENNYRVDIKNIKSKYKK